MQTKLQNSGFTLVEIMVSLAIGLAVIGMIVNIFGNTRLNHVQSERVTEVLESGRFAVNQLAKDLKMVGLMGGVYDMSTIARDSSLSITSGSDCGEDSETNWAFDLNTYRAMQFTYNTDAAGAHTQHKCISTTEFKPSTDVLAIKRTYSGTSTGSLTDKTAYLRSDYSSGCLWWYDSGTSTAPTNSNCPTADFEDWQYMVHVYYIRSYAKTAGDGIPTLCRKRLAAVSGAPAMNDLCLAEGVEHFHVQYGLDATAPFNGVADTFDSSPTEDELKKAVSARIFVLARAEKEDPVFHNTKTYTMGDRTVGPMDDNYYRRMYSTTVILRNPASSGQFTN